MSGRKRPSAEWEVLDEVLGVNARVVRIGVIKTRAGGVRIMTDRADDEVAIEIPESGLPDGLLKRRVRDVAAHPERMADARAEVAPEKHKLTALLIRTLLTFDQDRKDLKLWLKSRRGLKNNPLPFNTKEDENLFDLFCAEELVALVAHVFAMSPLVTPGCVEPLMRAKNTLHDVRVGSKSPLLELPDSSRPKDDGGSRVHCQAMLAAALEIVYRHGGLKPWAKAKLWLEKEMRYFGVVDAAGGKISANRIDFWRKNCESGVGAARMCDLYAAEIAHFEATRSAPVDGRELALGHGRQVVCVVAFALNHTVKSD